MTALVLAAVLDLASYRARLERIDSLLAEGNRDRAAADAKTLLGDTVRAGAEDLAPDEWTLAPIARGDPHRARLRGLLVALRARESGSPRVDRALLERVRKAQAERERGGGEIGPLPVEEVSFVVQLGLWAKGALRWIGRRLLDLLDWFLKLFPKGPGDAGATFRQLTRVVLIGVGVILVLVLALALASAQRGPPRLEKVRSTGAAKDEDPLSRTASGWEARASELAREGRAREAIRAWYHAILVRSYAAGILHYRRGRTNWEYMRALSPQVAWRPQFEDLTRRFDVEWYGHAESSPEALSDFATTAQTILRGLGSRT